MNTTNHDVSPAALPPGWLKHLFGLVSSAHPAVASDELRRKCEDAAVAAANEAYALSRLATAARSHEPRRIPFLNEWLQMLADRADVPLQSLDRWFSNIELSNFDDVTEMQAKALATLALQLGIAWGFARMIFVKTFLHKFNLDPFESFPPAPAFRAPGYAIAEDPFLRLEAAFDKWKREECEPDIRKQLNAFLAAIENVHSQLAANLNPL